MSHELLMIPWEARKAKAVFSQSRASHLAAEIPMQNIFHDRRREGGQNGRCIGGGFGGDSGEGAQNGDVVCGGFGCGDRSPSLHETIRAMQQLPCGKASESDAFPFDIYKHVGPQLMEHLTVLFQEM
nr:unnamed protein product [Spirometra erinaceieuropaei]